MRMSRTTSGVAMALAMTGALVRAQVVVRQALVSQPDGSPVVLEASTTTSPAGGPVVTLRNVAEQAVVGVTVITTVGRVAGTGTALRRTEERAVVIAPGATADVPVMAVDPAAAATWFPTEAAVVAERAVWQGQLADGTTWQVRWAAGWLGRPEITVALQCLDAAGAVHAVGEAVVAGGTVQTCAADGTLTNAAGGQ